MKVKFVPADLARSRWYEYAIRFLFGGAITAIAGIVARQFGPAVGGLLLAFPAILPASASLIEKHEIQKKRQAGLDGSARGRKAATLDATGAAIGSIGLVLFGLVVWKLLASYKAAEVMAAATLIWFAAAVLVWWLRETARHRLRRLAKSIKAGVPEVFNGTRVAGKQRARGNQPPNRKTL
jgi:hypothetical protein